MDGDLDIEKAADALIELAAVLDCNVEDITDLLEINRIWKNDTDPFLSEAEVKKILWLTNPDE